MNKDRYEEATADVNAMVEHTVDTVFPDLRDAKIYNVFDLKKRKSRGRLTLASIKKANTLIKFLTTSNLNSEGYDYIIFIDKLFWELASEEDKVRVIRHELQHAEVDPESEKDPFKLRDHELQDFYDEISYNSNDPKWCQRCVAMVEARYEQLKELAKNKK